MRKVLALTMAAALTAGALFGTTVFADDASGDFDWKRFDGEEITVLFSEHTYSNAVEEKLGEFTEKTGIKVNYSSMPEGNYFEKLNVELSSHSGSIDVFMTGAYQSWEYATAGNLEPLENFIDTDLTSPEWQYDDFIPAVIDALKWDCIPGHAVGEGSQWALPMGWEVNILTYNKRILEEKGIEPPKTAEDLLAAAEALKEFDGNGTYGIAVRGLPDWGTIHPAFMSLYSTWGAKDYEIEDGKLVSKVNSPEAVAMTEYWVDLVKKGGAPQWATYGWEMCGADLGAGKAAMMWDADRGGYTQNTPGSSNEAGNMAFGMVPYPESAGKTEDDMKSNLWVWSMAMNADSSKKEAAWYFMQYFTSPEYMAWAGVEKACTDTPRTSVLESEAYKESVANAEGYYEAFSKVSQTASIFFTAQPYFTETTTEWAKTLQELVTTDKYASVQDALDELKVTMDELVSDLEVE